MIRVTQDRVLVRPVRPVKAWVKDVAGDDPELQRLAINLANPYSDPVTMGEVVSVGESVGAAGLVRYADVREAFCDTIVTGELLDPGQISERLSQVRRTAPDFAVGDVIVFSPFVGQEFTVEGDEYIVLRAGDVLGVVDAAA